MKDLIDDFLNIGLTIGLSDRDGFVKNVSELLQKFHDDPKRAEKLAGTIMNYLEQAKENINTRNSIKSAISEVDFANNQRVSELTAAIRDLTKELRRLKLEN